MKPDREKLLAGVQLMKLYTRKDFMDNLDEVEKLAKEHLAMVETQEDLDQAHELLHVIGSLRATALEKVSAVFSQTLQDTQESPE